MEHDDLVDAVDEFGTERRLDLGHHRELDHSVVVAGHLLDHLRAEVRRHHDHGVLEVDRTSLPVGHTAVVEHLEEHVEDVGMRLLHFVQQDHAVGLAPHCLGQMAAFFIPDIARRRADQARNRVFLHELGHVDADEMLFRIEQEFSQRLAQLGLAHTRGS